MNILQWLIDTLTRWISRLRRRNISCAEFEEFILAYLEGELSVRERMIFESHLEGCVNCANYLEAYQRTVALGKKVFEVLYAPVPAEVPEELVQAILRARSG
jgi:anti-sigma factor RsiW